MKPYKVQSGQSLFDVAIIVYGDATGITWLIKDNNLSGPTDRIYEGQTLLYRPDAINQRQKIYLQDYSVIATIKDSDKPEGIGFWNVTEYVVQPIDVAFDSPPVYLPEIGAIAISIDHIGNYHIRVTNLSTGTVFRDEILEFPLDGNGNVGRWLILIDETGKYEILLHDKKAYLTITTL